jgi:hypothetical protein
MNKTQDMIAGKVSSMVSEHFSHALLVFSSDELDDDDFVCLRFFGGALTAVGMADYAKDSIKEMLTKSTRVEDDEDDEIIF